MDSYNGDIRFDNIYISTYFCQIDERRKKLVSGPSPALPCAPCGFALQEGRGEDEGAPEPLILRFLSQGKRTLLPLRKAEKKAVIFPYDPTIQALEMKNLVRRAGEARTRGGAGRGGRGGSVPTAPRCSGADTGAPGDAARSAAAGGAVWAGLVPLLRLRRHPPPFLPTVLLPQ